VRIVKERRAHAIGWGLFLASALSYTVSSWRSGDWPGLIGSLLFLVACLFFIAPMLDGDDR
jgi:hypothetical protein